MSLLDAMELAAEMSQLKTARGMHAKCFYSKCIAGAGDDIRCDLDEKMWAYAEDCIH